MYQIRWNNYDRSVKWDWTVEEQEAWYDAAGHFNEIIHRPNLEIWTQLEPGTALSKFIFLLSIPFQGTLLIIATSL